MPTDSPFFLGHLQGGEPDGVEVLLHPPHLVQGTPQVAHAVIQVLKVKNSVIILGADWLTAKLWDIFHCQLDVL